MFAGLITFPHEDQDNHPESVKLGKSVLDMLHSGPDGDLLFAKSAFSANWWTLLTATDPLIGSPAMISDVMDRLCVNCTLFTIFIAGLPVFCTSIVGMHQTSCVLLHIDFYSTVNEYAFEVNEPACANTVYRDSMQELVNKKPLELTERYFECVLTPWNAMFQALGRLFHFLALFGGLCF